MADERTIDGTVRSGAPALRSVVVSYDGRPDECTIFPSDVTGADRMSTWIAAEEGAYVDPVDWR